MGSLCLHFYCRISSCLATGEATEVKEVSVQTSNAPAPGTTRANAGAGCLSSPFHRVPTATHWACKICLSLCEPHARMGRTEQSSYLVTAAVLPRDHATLSPTVNARGHETWGPHGACLVCAVYFGKGATCLTNTTLPVTTHSDGTRPCPATATLLRRGHL